MAASLEDSTGAVGSSDTIAFALAHGKNAGAPTTFGILPHVPIAYNPCWSAKNSPSFAASLLAQDFDGRTAKATPFLSVLWRCRLHTAFYTIGTPLTRIPGHRASDLIPVALRGVEGSGDGEPDAPPETDEASKSATSETDRHALQLASGLAADLQPFYLKIFGWILSHLFRLVP
jgi:hypothetical protein